MQGLKQKLIVSGLGLGLLAGGAAGLVLGTSGVSGAQETTTTTTTAEEVPDEKPAEDPAEKPAPEDKADDKADDDSRDEPSAEAPAEEPGDRPADGERPERGERPSSEEFLQRRRDKLAETLAPLVAAGTIDQAQADAVIDALLAAQSEHGPGKGGFGGKGGHGGRGGFGSEAAAAALGITADELREALSSGSTLAQLAEEKGVDRQVLIDALTKEAKERIVAKVADGSLTQEQADEKLAQVDERAAARIDGTRGRG